MHPRQVIDLMLWPKNGRDGWLASVFAAAPSRTFGSTGTLACANAANSSGKQPKRGQLSQCLFALPSFGRMFPVLGSRLRPQSLQELIRRQGI